VDRQTWGIAVNLLITVFKENRFSTIAALRYVVR
jgi:hypothetical protein